MKAKDVQIGQTYGCRVSGVLRTVRVEREHVNWKGRTRFDCRNLETNRKIVASAGRLRPNGQPKIKPCGCLTCGHTFQATCRAKGCLCCSCKPRPVDQTDTIVHNSHQREDQWKP